MWPCCGKAYAPQLYLPSVHQCRQQATFSRPGLYVLHRWSRQKQLRMQHIRRMSQQNKMQKPQRKMESNLQPQTLPWK